MAPRAEKGPRQARSLLQPGLQKALGVLPGSHTSAVTALTPPATVPTAATLPRATAWVTTGGGSEDRTLALEDPDSSPGT